MWYYDTPPQEIFDDIKRCAISIWKTYDDEFGYATEKVSRVEPIENNQDNWLYIVAMFDIHNQAKLISLVQEETRQYLIPFIYPNTNG